MSKLIYYFEHSMIMRMKQNRVIALTIALLSVVVLTVSFAPTYAQTASPTHTVDLTAEGWVLFKGTAHPATLDLSGDGSKFLGGGEIALQGILFVGDRAADLDLTGIVHAEKHRILLKGTITDADDPSKSRKIILRGHYMPTEEDGVFAVAFAQAGYRDSTGERVRGILLGEAVLSGI